MSHNKTTRQLDPQTCSRNLSAWQSLRALLQHHLIGEPDSSFFDTVNAPTRSYYRGFLVQTTATKIVQSNEVVDYQRCLSRVGIAKALSRKRPV